MDFHFGTTVIRLRPKNTRDPYSNEDVAGDWSAPDELPIEGAFIAQSSTSILSSATRTQAIESKSLYCDPDADVQLGDRIRDGDEGAPVYQVDGIPSSDRNPFTGWQPAREIPLTRATG